MQEFSFFLCLILQENPGKAEYEAVMEILKQQKELLQVGHVQKQLLTLSTNVKSATEHFLRLLIFLQQDVNEGRDTSLNQLIMSVLRSLWKYFLFNSKRRGALRLNFTR